MQTKLHFVPIYMHSNTAARKNILMILIVSITKLLIELSIIVLIFDIK